MARPVHHGFAKRHHGQHQDGFRLQVGAHGCQQLRKIAEAGFPRFAGSEIVDAAHEHHHFWVLVANGRNQLGDVGDLGGGKATEPHRPGSRVSPAPRLLMPHMSTTIFGCWSPMAETSWVTSAILARARPQLRTAQAPAKRSYQSPNSIWLSPARMISGR